MKPKNENDERNQDYKIVLMVIGNTGDGKSTLCNTLVGREGAFKEGDGWKSETQKTVAKGGMFKTKKILVLDTPGLQDLNGNDQVHIGEMISELKKEPRTQCFAFVIDGGSSKPRFDIYSF